MVLVVGFKDALCEVRFGFIFLDFLFTTSQGRCEWGVSTINSGKYT